MLIYAYMSSIDSHELVESARTVQRVDQIDQEAVSKLIELTFGGVLVPEYFSGLSDEALVVGIDGVDEALSIIVPAGPEVNDAYYLDKIVSDRKGIGSLLLAEVIDYAGDRGVFWRARTGNEQLVDWYQSKVGNPIERTDSWTVFAVNVRSNDIAKCVERALSVPSSISY